MDQVRIGTFLKSLRKEKGITQEQLAETLGVSGRTISRWETGRNMPDISLLAELAAFFAVSIPEIIKGERKGESMNEEVKEVAEAMSDYARAEKETLVKSIRNLSILGFAALLVTLVLRWTGVFDRSDLFRYTYGISQAVIYSSAVIFPLYTTGLLSKFRVNGTDPIFRRVPGPVRKVIGFLVLFAAAALIRLLIGWLLG